MVDGRWRAKSNLEGSLAKHIQILVKYIMAIHGNSWQFMAIHGNSGNIGGTSAAFGMLWELG